MDVLVRRAGPGDLAAIGALTAEVCRADGRLAAQDEDDAGLPDAVRRSREAVLLVATVPMAAGDEREAVVGSLTAAPCGSSYAEVAEPGEWELRMLAVAPEARRRGVAAELVAFALREAVGAGVRAVVACTLDEMPAAHRLYARLGFVPVPARDRAHEGVRLRVRSWTPPAAPGVLVESATWPPVRTVDLAGWRVGLSGGLTRRANSVLALVEQPDVEAAVDGVEAVYAAAGLPPTFRVDADSRPVDLAARLAARGYRTVSVADVLVRPAAQAPTGAVGPVAQAVEPGRPAGPSVLPVEVQAAAVPDDAWVAAHLGHKGGDAPTARAILTGAPAVYLAATCAGRRVGIARLAFAGGWAALSCLAVVSDARRAGVARALSRHALAVAGEHGADRVFLQVERQNVAAWRLYSTLGFAPAARYAYLSREPAVTNDGTRPPS